MKLSFSERDEFGNGRGVVITLLKPLPEEIIEIAKYYESVGWKPNSQTRHILIVANKKIAQPDRMVSNI